MGKDMIAEIEMELLTNGVVLKGVDFVDDGESVKVIKNGKPHTRAEKIRNDNLYRVKITGKKHDRSREDYKDAVESNEDKRLYRLYIRGNYKDRLAVEKTKDAWKNEIADFEYLKSEEEKIERVKAEIKKRTENRIRRLRDEAFEMVRRAKALLDDADGNWSEADRLEASLKNDQ